MAAAAMAMLLISAGPIGFAAGLSTSNDAILDQHGARLVLKGANWFGFNNGQTMVSNQYVTRPGIHVSPLRYGWRSHP